MAAAAGGARATAAGGARPGREMYTPPHPSQSEKTELGHGFIEP